MSNKFTLLQASTPFTASLYADKSDWEGVKIALTALAKARSALPLFLALCG